MHKLGPTRSTWEKNTIWFDEDDIGNEMECLIHIDTILTNEKNVYVS